MMGRVARRVLFADTRGLVPMTIDRILAARHQAAESAARDDAAPGALDTIYVRGLELDAWIGIHHQEKGQTQRVRIDVEAQVLPAARNEDIRNTLCYDYIVSGIRDIIARGHINLTETLAEEIAAYILNHELARRVTVRVEKLERIPGAQLGVQITREKRVDSPADILPLPGQPQPERE